MSYFRDWFGRDKDSGYTGHGYSKQYISWDYGYDNYSDFIFGKSKSTKSKLDVNSTAELLLTMSKVLGVQSKRFNAYSSPDTVVLPTDMLNQDGVSTDIFLGAALQSMGNYTHTTRDERISLAKNKSGKMSITKFVQDALNAERINRLMGEDTPGYLKFVKKYKDFKYKSRVKPEGNQQEFLELFDRIIRYPDNITQEEIDKFKEPIEKIQKILAKSGGIPYEMEECNQIAKKITKIIQEFLKAEEDKSKDESKGEDGDEGDEESGTEGGSSEPDDSDKSEGKKSSKKFQLTPSLSEFADKLMASNDQKNNENTDLHNKFKEALNEIQETSGKTSVRATFIKPTLEKSHSAIYQRTKSRIDMTKASVTATLLKRKSRDYSFTIKSTRAGRLDTNKLAEAKQMVPTIYERMGSVKTDKLAVVVLVDESGSMNGSKIDKAREAAIYLSESLRKVKDVELFIYGHTADLPLGGSGGNGSTQIYVYKEPGYNDPAALGAISAKWENRDGTAIYAVAKRVRNFTQNNAVFVVLSDGEPSAHNYRHSTAKTDVRRRVNAVEKMGFQVIQVTIDNYDSRDMFKHVIEMNDINTFPTEFTNFLKRKINSLIKERITL